MSDLDHCETCPNPINCGTARPCDKDRIRELEMDKIPDEEYSALWAVLPNPKKEVSVLVVARNRITELNRIRNFWKAEFEREHKKVDELEAENSALIEWMTADMGHPLPNELTALNDHVKLIKYLEKRK